MKEVLLLLVMLFLFLSPCMAQWSRDQRIAAGEYFIDTDPGEGNGAPITGSYGLWEVTVNVDNLTVPEGTHLYVRFRSTNGKWSPPRAILRGATFPNSGATLAYAEYFINTDPGAGNATPIVISQNGVINLENLRLRRGDRVYLRLRDSFGRWSNSKSALFNFKDMLKAEYKIKHLGEETSPAIMNLSAPSDSSSVFVASQNNIPFLSDDTVYVRFQTTDRFYSKWTKDPLTIVGVGEQTRELPMEFALSQNYPNPFNPSTTITYKLPKTSLVNLSVYDVLGREVSVLVNERRKAGVHEVKFDASGLASGIYFYRLQAGTYVETRNLILLR